MSKYTDDDLINIIKNKAVELNRTPTKREIEHLGIIVYRFGTWNNAIEKADLKVLKRINYTKEELIKFIKDKAIKLERTPQSSDFSNLATITKHFGKLSVAIRKAGMVPYARTNKELLTKLKELKEKLGRSPSIRDADANELPSATYINRFGTWNNALKLAKIGINNDIPQILDSNEKLISKYIDFCNKLGRLATTKDLNTSEKIYSKNVFENRFESITNLKKIVLQDSRLKISDKTYREHPIMYSSTELKEMLKTILEENKNVRLPQNLLVKKLKENGSPSVNTFFRRFNTTKISELWDQVEKGADADETI
jgi:hypothetical protein